LLVFVKPVANLAAYMAWSFITWDSWKEITLCFNLLSSLNQLYEFRLCQM